MKPLIIEQEYNINNETIKIELDYNINNETINNRTRLQYKQ